MNKFKNLLQIYQENIEDDISKRIDFIKNSINQAQARGVVIGISGGIDSAVVAALCINALGSEKVLGVWMPAYSNIVHEKDANILAASIGLNLITVNLGQTYDVLNQELEKVVELDNLLKGNIKARLRMTTLYAIAGQKKYLVSDTCNLSEIYIGYMTKGGDGLADFNPIASLTKHQIRILARYLAIPQRIIDKVPSADLWEGQTDENEMGFTYEQLDNYLLTQEGEPEILKKIERLHKNSEHKRVLMASI
ncbi:MAG: NAD(+) synthase [Vulcanibacillus sp.]